MTIRHWLLPALTTLLLIPTISGQDAVRSTSRAETALENLQSELREAHKREVIRQTGVLTAREQVQQAEARLAELQERLQTADAERAQAGEQIAALEARMKAAEELVAQHQAADALQATATAAAERLERLTAERQRLTDERRRLVKDSLQWQAKSSEVAKKIADGEAALPGLQEAAKNADTAAQAAMQALAAAEADLKAKQDAFQSADAAAKTTAAQQTAATESHTALAASVESLRGSLARIQDAGKASGLAADEAVKSLQAAIDALLTQTAKALELTQMLAEKLKAEQTLVAEHQAALTAAEAAMQKTQSDMTTATDTATAARMALQTAEAALAEDRILQKESALGFDAISAQISGLDPSLQQLDAAVAMLTRDTTAAQARAEAALEPLHRFVSFSRAVAPILAKRCVACHNTRSSGGQLNLESFSHLMQGGESGALLEPGNGEASMLVQMTIDGSMPKDADPLSEEEVAVLRSWIDVGAPLDAGIVATAELFDVMPEVHQPLPPDTYRVPIPVTATAFNPDGSLLATSGYHEVLLWKTTDGTLARRITNIAERVYDVEFSNDGTLLAVAAGTPGQLGEAKLFRVTDGEHVRTLVRAKDSVFAVSFSADNSRVATAGADRSIFVLNTESGNVIHRIDDHADWVMNVNWSPDGTRLVSASRDKTCKIFDAATGQAVITFNGHTETVYAAVFLPDGNSIASGSGDRRIRIWNVADAKQAREITGFGGEIFSVVLTKAGTLLSASADKEAREHNPGDGKALRTYSGHSDWVYTIAFNAGRELVATGSYDGEVRVWNAQDATLQTTFLAIPSESPSNTVARNSQE